MAGKPTVSLVLGSGGARGLAHIGIIDALERAGYEVRSIAGTSMGALVGGIYAAGRLDVYTRWVTALTRIDVVRLLDFAYDRKGLFKGEKIINLLKDLIGDHEITSLPIAFTAVATDLRTQKEVWFNRGPLFEAIRASMAVPTIFTPYEYQGMQLVDGALVNPAPIAPTLHDKTDLTVVVNLNGPPDPRYEGTAPGSDSEPAFRFYHRRISEFIETLYQRREQRDPGDIGLIDIAARSMDAMQTVIARFRLAGYLPDVYIEIPGNVCAFHEFHRASELIDLGRDKAREALARLPQRAT
jgi:NTE family protein